MQVLIVLSAVLAVALAKPGYLGAGVVAPAAYAAPAVVAAPIHAGYAAYGPAPVAVRSDGYLLDTPAVAATRAAHLTAVAQTQARDAVINGAALAYAARAYATPAVAYAAPAAVAAPALAYAAPAAYAAHGALATAAHLHAKAALLG